MTNGYFLFSPRLGFRNWTREDLDLAVELWGDPRVTLLIDARGALTRDQVRARLEREIKTRAGSGVQYWPVFSLENEGFVGCCGLRPYDPEKNIYEIGFHIKADLWRRGLAREAALAVMEYAFGEIGASALFAGHNPANDSSRQLLEKLGFSYTHKEFYPPTGLEHPSYLLTAEDFRKMKG